MDDELLIALEIDDYYMEDGPVGITLTVAQARELVDRINRAIETTQKDSDDYYKESNDDHS